MAIGSDGSQTATMKREFGMWSAASLAFMFVSPIVAMYAIFSIGLATVGPGFWWGWVVCLAGQTLVAVTFGVLASRWPFAGGVYQWSRRLLGAPYGWAASWTYSWALLIALSSVAYGGAFFIAVLFGLDPANTVVRTGLAVGMLVVATAVNLIGRSAVKITSVACVAAEVLGSLGVGAYLLFFGRLQKPSIVLEGLHAAPGTALMMTPLIVAVSFAGWSFLGFESASAIAEEVREPARAVPRAIVVSLLAVGALVLFTSFGIIMATPDLAAILASGQDPVIAILAYHFSPTMVDVILVLFIIAFVATLIGVQASVSRVIWANAREGELAGAAWLRRLSGEQRMPRNAVLVTAVISIALFIPLQNADMNTVLIAFTTTGFFLAFLFPVAALVIAYLRGRWQPSEPTFAGRAGIPCAFLALAWLVLETVNVLWPRGTADQWLLNWSPVIATAVIAALGLLAYFTAPAHREAAKPITAPLTEPDTALPTL